MPSERGVRLEWKGEGEGEGLQFAGRGVIPESPSITIDGDSKSAPAPMQLLLLACASCSAADAVSILHKMRVNLRSLSVGVTGIRRDEEPRRYVAISFEFTASGEGLDRAKAERAVNLSIEKYCSVIHSLSPDIDVSYTVAVER